MLRLHVERQMQFSQLVILGAQAKRHLGDGSLAKREGNPQRLLEKVLTCTRKGEEKEALAGASTAISTDDGCKAPRAERK